MLAHVLAIGVGLASFNLYMAAFFFPEVHRRYDFTWSGVGMFYALVLWIYAGSMTGGMLLGQTASVALLGWLGWQTLSLRRSLTPIDQQTTLPGNARTVGEAVRFKMHELRSRSGNLRLPTGFDRFLKQLGNWLSQATSWIQGKLSGSQNPKRRSLTMRSRIQPVSRSAPTSPERLETTSQLEKMTDSQLEKMTEEEAEEERAEAVESLLEVVRVESVDKSDAALSDQPSTRPSTEVLSVEVVEPIADPSTATVSRVTNLRSRQQNNLLDSIRHRVQNTLNSLGQRGVQRPVADLRLSEQSLDELDDLDDELEGESIELEITTAVLEDNAEENGDGEDRAKGIVVAEIVVAEIVENPAEIAAAPPLSEDILDSENPECVTVADAVIEAEINLKFPMPPEQDSTPSPLVNPLATMPDPSPTPNPPPL